MVDDRISSLPVLVSSIEQASVHVVKCTLYISVPVNMGFLTSLFIIVKILVVPFLIRDLADLSHTVVLIGDRSPVGVSSAGNVPRTVISIAFHAALRRVDLRDSSPVIQNKICSVPISVLHTDHTAPGVIVHPLGRMLLPCIVPSPVNCLQIPRQVIIILCIKSLPVQPLFQISHAVIGLLPDDRTVRRGNPDCPVAAVIGVASALPVILSGIVLQRTYHLYNPIIAIIKQAGRCADLIRQVCQPTFSIISELSLHRLPCTVVPAY